MIGADSTSYVGVQVPARKRWTVAIYDQILKKQELVGNLGIGQNHTREVHHFRQAEQAFVGEQGLEIHRPEVGPGSLQRRSRNAARQIEKNIQGKISRALKEIPNPVQA